jgi:hypothetical protein
VQSAQIVFIPQHTGTNNSPPLAPVPWGDSYFEAAMRCRALENEVFFVSF